MEKFAYLPNICAQLNKHAFGIITMYLYKKLIKTSNS